MLICKHRERIHRPIGLQYYLGKLGVVYFILLDDYFLDKAWVNVRGLKLVGKGWWVRVRG